jgi:PrtD family type I secretion system ABC transporter
MKQEATPNLRRRLRQIVGSSLGVALFLSIASSILMLGIPIYSMQLFDRVVPTGHFETLLLLSGVLVLTVVVWGFLEGLRGMLMARLGTRLSDRIGSEIIVAAALEGLPAGRALRELEQVRHTVYGPAMQSIAELPWLPTGLIVLTALHPMLGLVTFFSAVVLGLLGWCSNLAARHRLRSAHELACEAHQRGDTVARSADLVRAMGMLPQLMERFQAAQRPSLLLQQQANESIGWLAGLVRATRLLVQAAIMGVAAWLIVERQLTPGALIAGSILASRTLAPLEQLLANWCSLIKASQSLDRLALVVTTHESDARSALPALPPGRLTAEAVGMVSDGGRPLLANISFALEPGTVLGVVGPSGAGKTTLCRLVAGCAKPKRGAMRMAGAELTQLPLQTKAALIGYLPQEPVVFAGTIAENIARMVVTPDPERVAEAARLAGIQDLILRLPQGYDTVLAEGGLPLSGGQRQRLGLARAIYGQPRLVVLDEPNAGLDGVGESALLHTVEKLKAGGAIVVLVTHRPSALLHADLVLMLENGIVARLGPREEVLPGLLQQTRAA